MRLARQNLLGSGEQRDLPDRAQVQAQRVKAGFDVQVELGALLVDAAAQLGDRFEIALALAVTLALAVSVFPGERVVVGEHDLKLVHLRYRGARCGRGHGGQQNLNVVAHLGPPGSIRLPVGAQLPLRPPRPVCSSSCVGCSLYITLKLPHSSGVLQPQHHLLPFPIPTPRPGGLTEVMCGVIPESAPGDAACPRGGGGSLVASAARPAGLGWHRPVAGAAVHAVHVAGAAVHMSTWLEPHVHMAGAQHGGRTGARAGAR